MLDNDYIYQIIKPDPAISGFVEMFWMLTNRSENAKEIVIIPDGRIDIIFSYTTSEPYHVTLLGVENQWSQAEFPAGAVFFSVSFKLLAVEYLLDTSIADLLNGAQSLPVDFWGIDKEDLNDFNGFCEKVSTQIKTLLKTNVDKRKEKLFKLIYDTNGSMTVHELADSVGWSSRQINRYFNERFGISLKAYCNILRFRASFQQIKEGKLFPEQNFTDQAHFIKEVKRLTGVVPKELSKNKNDRFLQFSTLPGK